MFVAILGGFDGSSNCSACHPCEPTLEGDHGDGVGQEVAARGKRQRCDKGLLIVDGDVCPDLGALYEEGEEEAQMEEDQVQDVN